MLAQHLQEADIDIDIEHAPFLRYLSSANAKVQKCIGWTFAFKCGREGQSDNHTMRTVPGNSRFKPPPPEKPRHIKDAKPTAASMKSPGSMLRYWTTIQVWSETPRIRVQECTQAHGGSLLTHPSGTQDNGKGRRRTGFGTGFVRKILDIRASKKSGFLRKPELHAARIMCGE